MQCWVGMAVYSRVPWGINRKLDLLWGKLRSRKAIHKFPWGLIISHKDVLRLGVVELNETRKELQQTDSTSSNPSHWKGYRAIGHLSVNKHFLAERVTLLVKRKLWMLTGISLISWSCRVHSSLACQKGEELLSRYHLDRSLLTGTTPWHVAAQWEKALIQNTFLSTRQLWKQRPAPKNSVRILSTSSLAALASSGKLPCTVWKTALENPYYMSWCCITLLQGWRSARTTNCWEGKRIILKGEVKANLISSRRKCHHHHW